MEISGAIAGLVSVGAAHGLAFSKLLLPRNSTTAFAIAAVGSLPTDSVSSPTVVRSGRCKIGPAPRALVRRTRRTKRRSLTDDGGEDGLSGDGDGDDGPFGGGGSGSGRGGGRGWDYGGYGGPDWEEPSPSSSDPAFDYVYEVLSWLALSNCAHYAYKKIGRFLTVREKMVPVRLVQSIC